MAQNREKRVDVELTTTIGVGNFMFEGLVANVSRNGFKVTDLPIRFEPNGEKMLSVIATPQGNFKMDVRSTWVKESGSSQDVGFEILSFGSEWMQLMDRLDPVEKRILKSGNWANRIQ